MEATSRKTDERESPPKVKKPYTPPVLQYWGSLADITLAHSLGGKSDGGNKILSSRTN